MVAANKTRFISKTLDGDDVVIDNATGLMWPVDGSGAGFNSSNVLDWSATLAYNNLLDFAGFTDWRLPNVRELLSLIDYAAATPFLPVEFINITADVYWTSTTLFGSDSNAWTIDLTSAMLDNAASKVETHYFIAVRGGV